MRLTSTFDSSGSKPTEKRARLRRAPERDAATDEPSPAARNLALAHHLQRLIDRGVIKDYSQAARMLGVSQVRITHLMSLLLLAPQTQAAILAGTIAPGDKQLRQLARIADWSKQADLLASFTASARGTHGLAATTTSPSS
jgi:hypothetical protein